MKFTVSRNELSDAVTKLSRAVAVKSSVPVLEGILFSAKGDKLSMAAYNYEIGIKKEIDIFCQEEGSIVISAKLFGDILRKMPEDRITVETDEKSVCHILAGTSEFEIVGIEATDFPELPNTESGTSLNFNSGLMKSMIRQTSFAVDELNTMPMYTGIYFEIESDYIKLVALDGLRVAIRKENINNESVARFVVPGKSLNEVFRMLESDDEDIKVEVVNSHVSFEIDGYYLVSRLIEGKYLDYNSIKQDYSTKFTVKTGEIIDILERMSLIISNPKNTPIRCKINENTMLFTTATTVGRASDSCEIENSGSSMEFGFNAKFMLEAMKATECDEVYMTFNGNLAPITIKPLDGDDFNYIVMPMRLR